MRSTTCCFSDAWTGELVFTGSSPVPLEAGPAKEALADDVRKEREQGLEEALGRPTDGGRTGPAYPVWGLPTAS